MEEGNRASKKERKKQTKKQTKKSSPIVKNREEFADNMGDDSLNPNDNPERLIEFREQFIKRGISIERVLAGKQAPFLCEENTYFFTRWTRRSINSQLS